MPQGITNSLGNGQIAETVPKFRYSALKPTNLLALVLSVAIVGMAPPVGAQPFTNNIIIASQHATLQDAIDAAGEQGMVIVDQDYPNLEPIVLPRRLRMDGMGPRGRAVLGFDGVLEGPAISIAPPAGDDLAAWVVIENLDISGPLPGADPANVSSHGIRLLQANRVFLRNLSIHGFGVGVFGIQSSSVHVENCSLSESVTDNYRLTGQSDSWRITGGWSSLAGSTGWCRCWDGRGPMPPAPLGGNAVWLCCRGSDPAAGP